MHAEMANYFKPVGVCSAETEKQIINRINKEWSEEEEKLSSRLRDCRQRRKAAILKASQMMR